MKEKAGTQSPFNLQMRDWMWPSAQFWEKVAGFRSQYSYMVWGNTAWILYSYKCQRSSKWFFYFLFQRNKYIILFYKCTENSQLSARVIKTTIKTTNSPTKLFWLHHFLSIKKKIENESIMIGLRLHYMPSSLFSYVMNSCSCHLQTLWRLQIFTSAACIICFSGFFKNNLTEE